MSDDTGDLGTLRAAERDYRVERLELGEGQLLVTASRLVLYPEPAHLIDSYELVGPDGEVALRSTPDFQPVELPSTAYQPPVTFTLTLRVGLGVLPRRLETQDQPASTS